MLERTPYFDPRTDTSTRTSVVRPQGNPQQVVVTEVDAPEFFNQGTDFQPSMVDPRWGLLHTQPAILTPDYMAAHRWPDEGPYRGMVAQPFSWEEASLDGFGTITQAQRDQYSALLGRITQLEQQIARARAGATPARLEQLASIEGQLDGARALLLESAGLGSTELAMAMSDVGFALDEVDDRLAGRTSGGSAAGQVVGRALGQGIGRALLVGGALVAVTAFAFWSRRKQLKLEGLRLEVYGSHDPRRTGSR